MPYKVSMLPFPGSKDWYFATIPGFPAQNYTFRPLLTTYYVNITTSVSYSILLGGSSINSSSYVVRQVNRTYATIPPLVTAFVSSALDDSSILQETGGLSPSGWVAGPSDSVAITFFAFSPFGIAGLDGFSSISGSPYAKLPSSEDLIQATAEQLIQPINNNITYINNVLGALKSSFQFSNLTVPFMAKTATISPVALGNYVKFTATALDSRGTSNQAPIGFYYIVNTAATTRILVIDPHVKLYVLLNNVQLFANLTLASSNYTLPAALSENNMLLTKASQLASNYLAGQFHNWHLLGENYNIRISFPDPNIANLLQPISSGGFQPEAIYLSELALGYAPQSSSLSSFFDWDLRDINDASGSTILSDVINYTKTNHAGLIGSGGTLSDWVVWTAPSRSLATKIGARGNVGDQMSDWDPINEKSLSAMFGMPLLPLFEYVRDQIATALCQTPPTALAGELVGSTPLLVPIMPWNGTIASPDSSLIPNVNDEIMKGIPSFEVIIPSYQPYFNAINTIGWQLSLPSVLADAAWKAANASRAQIGALEQNMIALSANITSTDKSAQYYKQLDYALSNWLHDQFGSMVQATINDTGIAVSVNVPSYGSYSKFISLDIKSIVSLWPIRIAALSPDDAAGVVTYDKYFDSGGYRSVYFSFPSEASSQWQAITMLKQAIEWTRQWSYKSLTNIVGGLIVSSNTYQTLQNATSQAVGSKLNVSTLANAAGASLVKFSASSPGIYALTIVHPTSGNVSITAISGALVIGQSYLGSNVTVVNVNVVAPAVVAANITDDALGSLNPMFVSFFPVGQPIPEFPQPLLMSTVLFGLAAALLIERRLRYQPKHSSP